DPPATDLAYAALSGLGQGLARRRERLSDRIAKLDTTAQVGLNRLLQTVATSATSMNSKARTPAIELLSYVSWKDAQSPLETSLGAMQPPEVQWAALRALASFNEPLISSILLNHWRQLTPPLRDETITVLLSR